MSVARALERLRTIHRRMRDHLVCSMASAGEGSLSRIDHEGLDDTIYAIDIAAESVLLPELEAWSKEEPLRVVGEGLGDGGELHLPHGCSPEWHLLIDPIDGTRGLMFGKRSAWILTGIAPGDVERPRLRDIVCAVQTEVPIPKQTQADQHWAIRGHGASACRDDLARGESQPLPLRASRAEGLQDGFASLSKFFPEAKAELAAIESEVLSELQRRHGERGLIFDDQYISTGGQIVELIVGHDRFNGDLRAVLKESASLEVPPRTGVHPYDLAASLIAEEAGVILTNGRGGILDAPFDVTSDVSWLGYANGTLRAKLEPIVLEALERRGWLG
ncbi:MAG: inositol monophosphatase [Planctomycetota bacterium]